MLSYRKLGEVELYQLIEFSGPTHDTAWLFSDLSRQYLDKNGDWLYPHYWSPETNRMVFSMPVLVLKTRSAIIVIDTGVGNFRKRRSSSQHMINTPFIEWLEAIGAPPEKVTHVVNTHLHGDHVGWNTHLTEDGWVPFFPEATYYMPKKDYDTFLQRYETGEREVYGRAFAECVLPILDYGLHKWVEDGDVIAHCLVCGPVPGHTPGQKSFALQADREYIFSADAIHSPTQVYNPDICTRWCELPDLARQSRLTLLNHAADTGAVLFTAHARNIDGWSIGRGPEGFTFNGNALG